MADLGTESILSESERRRRRDLLESHEELLAAARCFGATLVSEYRDAAGATPEALLEELEAAAGRLDEAALAYGRAREAYGPCVWIVSDVLAVGSANDDKAEALSERSAALYAAAEAVADLTADGPAQAVDAARTILSRAAVAFYEISHSIVAYTATLRRS